jgi:ribosomal protein L37AE/L43A
MIVGVRAIAAPLAALSLQAARAGTWVFDRLAKKIWALEECQRKGAGASCAAVM